ncbi:MAG: DUF4838 domain-containing protein [Clostridia bacterium]|nr:DUF4838 domain-containing protein [Clostridia bacterium]
MKKSKKGVFSAICLSLALVFSFGCSCAGATSGSNPSGNDPSNTDQTGTGYYLVENGHSDYTIVVPKEADKKILRASEELTDLFKEATGVALPTKTDEEVSYSDEGKYFILGDTKFSDKTDVKVAEIPSQGFVINTVGKNVFIQSKDPIGTLYGVYEYLNQTLNYEYYSTEVYSLDKMQTVELELFDNFCDSPDILYRNSNYGMSTGSEERADKFRMTYEPWLTDRYQFAHNAIHEFFDSWCYEEKKDVWYAESGEQLCYTAHGDADELKAMQAQVVKRMKEVVEVNYARGNYAELISFTQTDGGGYCECDACKAAEKKYGAKSWAIINFINPVAREMKAWMETTYPTRKLTIAIFAYSWSIDPPGAKQEPAYSDLDETCYLEDNVAMIYAPIKMNFNYDFDHEVNKESLELLQNWSKFTKNFLFWTYSANFNYYFTWYDSFNSMQAVYRKAKESGAIWLFDQANEGSRTTFTAFGHLKHYLNCKLAWNVDADVAALTKAFFKNYFEDASESMLRYYEGYRAWSEYIKNYENASGDIYANLSEERLFPKDVLLEWMDCIESAYVAIEYLKNEDYTLYCALKDRITAESIAIRYQLIQIHSSSYPEEKALEMKYAFKKDLASLGFTSWSSVSSWTLNKLYSDWGIN